MEGEQPNDRIASLLRCIVNLGYGTTNALASSGMAGGQNYSTGDSHDVTGLTRDRPWLLPSVSTTYLRNQTPFNGGLSNRRIETYC